MTGADLITATLQRLDQPIDGSGYYTRPQVLSALVAAQELWALLTFCVQRTQAITVQAQQHHYQALSLFPDWIAPLRVRCAGVKLHPGRLQDFDALGLDWQSLRGNPQLYACLGFDLLIFAPVPQDTTAVAEVTYAACPDAFTETTSPTIPAEDHAALIDFALVWPRCTEGGQEFTQTAPRFDAFLAAAEARAEKVREQFRAWAYDRMPTELQRLGRKAREERAIHARR